MRITNSTARLSSSRAAQPSKSARFSISQRPCNGARQHITSMHKWRLNV